MDVSLECYILSVLPSYQLAGNNIQCAGRWNEEESTVLVGSRNLYSNGESKANTSKLDADVALCVLGFHDFINVCAVKEKVVTGNDGQHSARYSSNKRHGVRDGVIVNAVEVYRLPNFIRQRKNQLDQVIL